MIVFQIYKEYMRKRGRIRYFSYFLLATGYCSTW